MSLTPLDESDSEPREGGRPPGDGTGDSAGFLDRVKGVIGRVVAALSGGADSRDPTVEPERRDGGGARRRDDSQSGTALDARTAERSLTWADDPEDDRPGSDDGVDRPDLVASWDDRGLTLSEPDGEESSISSDTWMDVER